MPDLTIIVPTYNERDNVAVLVDRLAAALDGHDWSVLFVDDNSPDGTSEAVDAIAKHNPRVACLKRIGRRGLSSAVIEGMQQAAAPYLAVMDADLQHDETVLPQMLDALKQGGTELVAASRYMAGGGMQDWPKVRRMISRTATGLTNLVLKNTPRLTDPMSGFFMIRREVFEEVGPKLSGTGFKILLDFFLSANRSLVFQEVPFTFRPRHMGESKLDVRVSLELIEMLAERTVGRIVPVKFILFTAVGAIGVGVHLGVLGIAIEGFALAFNIAQILAIWVAMTSNFFLNNIVTFRDTPLVGGAALLKGLLSFYVACSLGAVVNFAVATFMFETLALWAVAGFTGAVAGAVWNYATTSAFTWKRHKNKSP